MRNFIEFFDYISANFDGASMWFGFITCMLFDALFSLDSFLLEKAFDLFAKRRCRHLKAKKQEESSDGSK